MQKSIVEYFNNEAIELIKNIQAHGEVTPETVHRNGEPKLKALLESILDTLVLNSSEFRHTENIENFFDAVNSGKKGIILAEHYSNFDYPILLKLLRSSCKKGAELEKRCVAIAGLKLNEDNPYVAGLAAGYDRIYIYPSRTIHSITDKEEMEKQIKRSKRINIASMRALEKTKKEGKVVVVYPSGTRYRPGRPETKKGVKEIASYIKMSDVMLLVSVNGNCLKVSETGTMQDDQACKDRIILDASPVINCEEFRNQVYSSNRNLEGVQRKQAVVDKVMEILDKMHNENEENRLDNI